MKKTIENLLLNVMELATAALADGAPAELKHQAAAALRGVAGMIDGGAATAAAAPAPTSTAPSSTSTAPSSTPPASSSAPAPAAEPARPDFMSVLMSKLAPMLPDGAVAEAAQAARAEGFQMPMGIDLDKFVAAQAAARA